MSKKVMNILFRADSSSTIGTGHIMRDLVLASQYKDASIIFAVQDLKGNINHKIIEAGYKVKILKFNDIEEITKLVQKLNIDLLVIDHYEIDSNYEKQLKIKNSTLKILSFDDTYEKHYCDILLNHNISADKKRYKGLVPKNCKLRCGSKYTLLRDEFIKEKKKIGKKKKLKIQHSTFNIFVAMGGSDSSNLNPKILKILSNFKNIKVNLVTTDANSNLNSLKKYSKNKSWVNLYINSDNIAKIIVKSDLAIITPSVIANEVYYMKIPILAIKIASNQDDIYKFLKKEKSLVLRKFNKNKLKKLLISKGIK